LISAAAQAVFCSRAADGIGDPAPGRCTALVTGGRELVGSSGAFPGCLSPYRLSMNCAARQMSISGIIPQKLPGRRR
jgi:hypothetical protein